MNLQYKKVAVNEIEELVRIRIRVLRAANKLEQNVDMEQVEKESYLYYQKALPKEQHIAYLVYDGDTLAGAGGISFYQVMPTYHNITGKKAYIMNMYTVPEYRRKGIAWRTLELLVQEALQKGVRHISLEATDMGRSLYQKYGFISMKDEMELPNLTES